MRIKIHANTSYLVSVWAVLDDCVCSGIALWQDSRAKILSIEKSEQAFRPLQGANRRYRRKTCQKHNCVLGSNRPFQRRYFGNANNKPLRVIGMWPRSLGCYRSRLFVLLHLADKPWFKMFVRNRGLFLISCRDAIMKRQSLGHVCCWQVIPHQEFEWIFAP